MSMLAAGVWRVNIVDFVIDSRRGSVNNIIESLWLAVGSATADR